MYPNPGDPRMESGKTIPMRPPGTRNCEHLSMNRISGGTDDCKRSVILQVPVVLSFSQMWASSNCSRMFLSLIGILLPNGGFVTITSKNAILSWLRISDFLICSASASRVLNSSVHSCGGRREFVCRIFPLPSLFMTMFILVALTKSGLISKPKKLVEAISEIRS